MTDKLSKTFPTDPSTTDDSKTPAKKTTKISAKSTTSDNGSLTSARLEQLDKQVEEAQEKRKQEVARLRKKVNRERLKQKKAERGVRNRQLTLLGVSYDWLERNDKNGLIYDQNTEALNKALVDRKDRAVFKGRIPERHRTDKGDDDKK